MRITIHRGINQIGGCITEIESVDGTRILIDLGHNLPQGEVEEYDSLDKSEDLETLLKGVSHIFYSHYHSDHIGFESKVPDSVQQHLGSLSLKMLRVLREHMSYAPSLRDEAYKSLLALERFNKYNSYKREIYGGIAITPLPVSHSAIDAHMFFIECDGKTVLHTGDFREHGYNGKELLQNVFSYISHPVDVLITEGTLLGRNDLRMITEYQLKEKAKLCFKKYNFVLCSSMDIDRLTSFITASQEQNPQRRIIADRYQIEQIMLIRQKFNKPYSDIFAYPYGRDWKKELYRMHKYGFLMFVRCSDSFVKYIDEIMKVMDVNPNDIAFFYSMFSGYIDKKHKAYRASLYNFVNRYSWKLEYLHTSGHASKDTLREICSMANPNYAIIPIHKEGKGNMGILGLKTNCPIIEETTTIKDIEIFIK